MKHIYFHRENNDFTDILSDSTIKKSIKETTTLYGYLILGIPESTHEHLISYITLKYGDSIRSSLVKDYSPIPNVDYIPIRK
jgi:hypothetical protein